MSKEVTFNNCSVCGRLVINDYCSHPTTTDKENK
jgi:hypothetical protein